MSSASAYGWETGGATCHGLASQWASETVSSCDGAHLASHWSSHVGRVHLLFTPRYRIRPADSRGAPAESDRHLDRLGPHPGGGAVVAGDHRGDRGANVFMLIISRNSLGSKVCRDEIELALQNHKRIVPILVDQLTPEEIAGLAPDLPQFNWVVFERDHIFRLEVDPAASSEKAEDREVALAKLPQFEEALRKLSVAIHTDWEWVTYHTCLLYTSPSPRDRTRSRMPSS